MIARIWRAYRVESAKAARRRFTYAGPVLVVLAVLCMPLARPLARNGASDYGFIAYVSPVALNLVGFLMLLMYCAGLVASELGSGALCLMLVRPLRRREFLFAKILLGMSYAVVLTAGVGAAAWLTAAALGDLNGVAFGGEVIYTGIEMVRAYVLGAALALLPQFAAVAFAVMMSTLTRSSGAAIGSTVGVWLLLDLVKHPLRVAPFLFFSYLESPWSVFAAHCEGLNAAWFPHTAYAAATSLVSFVVFAGVSVAVLSRRNVHA
jgi:hypothetical protein